MPRFWVALLFIMTLGLTGFHRVHADPQRIDTDSGVEIIPSLIASNPDDEHASESAAPKKSATDANIAPTEMTTATATTTTTTTAPADSPNKMVGWLEISGQLHEGPVPVAWISEDEAGPTMRSTLSSLRYVADTDTYAGIVIYLDEPMLGLTQVYRLGQAIGDIRQAGKKVLVFAEQYDLNSYLLACHADQILLQKKGQVTITGLGIEEMYLVGLLEKVGLKADFLQVGDFKGASEQLTRSGPSDQWNENFDALLDDLYAQILDIIAEGRNLTHEQIENAFAKSWAMDDNQLVVSGLVDRMVERDLFDATESAFGLTFTWDEDFDHPAAGRTMPNNPFAIFQMLFQAQAPRVTRPSIAVIHAVGPIMSGESSAASPASAGLFSEASIGSRTTVRALGNAADDEQIKGIILRIDSPGGSALASEIIWQAIRDAGAIKPVYVSVGAMAASGGYYLACAGDRIYLAPNSIVGSIGVVGGKIIMGDLYEKIGITTYRRSRGPLGDMFNSVEPFTDRQRATLQIAFEHTYELFRKRVTTGRGNRLADIESVSAGRLFTGRTAITNGLGDRLGSVDTAITDMANDLGLIYGQYDVIDLPPPLSFAEFLESLFQPFGASAASARTHMTRTQMIATARELLGPRAWQSVAPVLSGMMLLQHEPVLTLMPYAIIVR